MSELKDCSTCLYTDSEGNCAAEQCLAPYRGWRPKDQPISFIDKVKEALPNAGTTGAINPVYTERHTGLAKEKFSLDKLIEDHWGYISKLIDVTQMHPNPKEKAIAEFHYRTAAVHFWKHCCEHYGIEEKNDE